MRDAIGEKGSFNELKPAEAAERGCLGTLQNLHRRGRVTFNIELCKAAAYGGQLEVLKWLREIGCPWDEMSFGGRRRAGTSRCCSGRARTDARGTRRRAGTLR